MSLWLAVDIDNKALGVECAESTEQAYYQFMQIGIYPKNVIQLPDSLVTRKYMNDQIDTYANFRDPDDYYFSDNDDR